MTPLTGREQFTIRGYRQPARVKRLSDMTADEVLCVANDRETPDPTRKALYQWQAMRRREARP